MCQDSVDESTDVLVVGEEERDQPEGRAPQLEAGKARQLRAEGKAIKIIDEDDLLALVTSPAAPA
jgi:hypothetical protein